MQFYTGQHQHYCGIDLHAATMYVCILDAAGEIRVHRNVKSSPKALLDVVAPFRDGLVVVAETPVSNGKVLAELAIQACGSLNPCNVAFASSPSPSADGST